MGQFYDEEKIKAMESAGSTPGETPAAGATPTGSPSGRFYDEEKIKAMTASANPVAARTRNLAVYALIVLLILASVVVIGWKVTHNPATMILDINKASAAQLSYLPGIGEAKARDIIDHRPYATIEDLKKVPGIGAKTFEKLKPRVKVD